MTEVIGSGNFGEVDRGLWKSNKKDTTLEVALKTIPKEGKADHRIKLLQEALIMEQFSHPNVVQFFGIISHGDPVSAISKKYMVFLRIMTPRLPSAPR